MEEKKIKTKQNHEIAQFIFIFLVVVVGRGSFRLGHRFCINHFTATKVKRVT